MRVDAEMFVRLARPVSDEELTDLCYRVAEAVKNNVFWFSNTEDLARGEKQRALNRIDEDDVYYMESLPPGSWLRVRLWGRYYGPGYERGNLWDYIQVAEWLERNIPACEVYYGGDTGERLARFDKAYRESFIQHWATQGHRPYYQSGWSRSTQVSAPTCPLCERLATQYGSGGGFASWSCDACGRQWVWVTGLAEPRLYDAGRFGGGMESFKRAEELRKEVDAAQQAPSNTKH